MKLSDDARLALKVMRWALANDWKVKDRSMFSFDGYERSTTWTNGVDPEVTVWAFQDGGAILYDASDVDVHSVTQAVDALVMFEHLPVTFSSAYRAGRESAYDRDEWRVCVIENKHHAPEFQFPAIWCNSENEPEGREDLAMARLEDPDAWLEHRRTGATDWSRVDA